MSTKPKRSVTGGIIYLKLYWHGKLAILIGDIHECGVVAAGEIDQSLHGLSWLAGSVAVLAF